MQQSNQFFATARPGRLFFTVAIPGMISMLAMSAYSIMEGIFIGNFLGEAAFAAVNLAIPLVFINFSLADLIGVGSAVPISIALGRKDHKRANNVFTCSVILIFLAAFFMGALLWFGTPWLLNIMGADGELARLALRYVRIYALMSPITTVVFAMDNYLRISGFVKGSMVLNIAMNLLTVVLLFIFLSPLGMNVEGSALATCISMATAALVAFIPFLLGRAVLRFTRPRFSWDMIRQIVTCGSPTFLNNISGRVTSIVMNAALLRMGGQMAVAAYSVMMYASDIVQPMIYGLCDSTQPAIGYNWGGRSLDRVRDITKYGFAVCGIVSAAAAVFMWFFPRQITGIFVDGDSPELLAMATRGLRFFCLAYLVRWLGFATQGFYAAIEKPLPASIISVASAMVFPILFIVILSPMGLDGLWLNMGATAMAVGAVSLIMLLRSQKKMRQYINAEPKY